MKNHRKLWPKVKKFISRHSKLLLGISGVLLVVYVFVPQLGDLKESLQAVESSNKTLLFLAIIAFTVGFPVIAQKYYLIAQYPLSFRLNLKVQTASAFVSKLLPMSIGSLTVNTYYLTKESKSPVAAASTMTFNAVTSSIAFTTMVILALIASWGTFSTQETEKNISWLTILALIVVACVGIWGLFHIGKIRNKLRDAVKSLWLDFLTYKKYPKKVTYGIIFNGLGSLTGITALYVCAHSVGVPVTLAQAILTYTLGNIIGSLVPTPGGLGGVEAGLYSGLVFFGYDTNSSLVAVLLYRLISYWIPIIPGYAAYRSLRKDVLADFKLKKKSV